MTDVLPLCPFEGWMCLLSSRRLVFHLLYPSENWFFPTLFSWGLGVLSSSFLGLWIPIFVLPRAGVFSLGHSEVWMSAILSFWELGFHLLSTWGLGYLHLSSPKLQVPLLFPPRLKILAFYPTTLTMHIQEKCQNKPLEREMEKHTCTWMCLPILE